MLSYLSGCILSVAVLILSECDQIANMKKIAPTTHFFSDLYLECDHLNHPLFMDKTILFVIHGYNNTFDYALQNIHQICLNIEKLKNIHGLPLYDVIIGYLWPGYDNFSDYKPAVTHAKALKQRIRKHLFDLHHAGAHVDTIAHSLGNRVLLEALNMPKTTPITPLIRHCFALAPAIDAMAIGKNGSLYGASQNCTHLFVFYSDKDDILKLFYPLISGKEALGTCKGAHLQYASNNLQFIDSSFCVDSHGDFFTSQAVYLFIEKINHQINPLPTETKKVTLLKDGSIKHKKA